MNASGKVKPSMLFPRHTIQTVVSAATLLASASIASAQNAIDLSLVGPAGTVSIGETIDVKLRATRVAKKSFVGTSFVGIDCILGWNPKHLTLLGRSTTGSVPLMASYFPTPSVDTTGINELVVPADGDALYYAIANFGSPVQVSAAGVQVTTFRFKVNTAFASSTIDILPTLTVLQVADTLVYDGTVPGLDVLGALHAAVITQAPACPGDINADGQVSADDLSMLLSNWGNSGSGDIDGSGVVDASDLASLLGSWGSCGGT